MQRNRLLPARFRFELVRRHSSIRLSPADARPHPAGFDVSKCPASTLAGTECDTGWFRHRALEDSAGLTRTTTACAMISPEPNERTIRCTYSDSSAATNSFRSFFQFCFIFITAVAIHKAIHAIPRRAAAGLLKNARGEPPDTVSV